MICAESLDKRLSEQKQSVNEVKASNPLSTKLFAILIDQLKWILEIG